MRGAAPWADWSRDQLVDEVARLRSELREEPAVAVPHAVQESLSTVRVPAPLTQVFREAERFVASYFDHFRRDPTRATIDIAGERYVLLRAASLSVEFVELVMSLYRDRGDVEARAVANNLLFDFGHALGRADARAFHQRTGVTDPIARLSTGPVHFAFSGWAFVDILDDSAPAPDEKFFLHYDHPFSFESHSWLEKGRQSAAPVCVMNAGYSSGWCEDSFGLSLVSTEVECTAAGGERCRFIMAPPSQIPAHLERLGYHTTKPHQHGNHSIAVPEFFQRRRWEDELREANQRLEENVATRTSELTRANEELRVLGKAIENALEGVAMLRATDSGGLDIRSVNRGFEVVTGIAGSDAVGDLLSIIDLDNQDPGRLEEVRGQLRARRPLEMETNARRPDGSDYTVEMHIMPVDADDELSRDWIGLFRDVTRRRRHLAELRRQATIDVLTSLPNRAMLYETLAQEVEHVTAAGGEMALLLIDLDGFKNINDTFGHHVGDSLLEQVGPRLKRGIRSRDLVARLGGDEFAILLPDVGDRANAVKRADDMQQALHEPFAVAEQELVLGASIGIAMCPEHGNDVSSLLRRADVAMYVSKDRKRGPELYSAGIDRHSAAQLSMLSELRGGIETDQLVLHYQPQVELASGRLTRVEALVRWNNPQRGLLAPGEFIPFIELGNLIELLTDWVLLRALADCARWRRAGFDMDVAINVPPRLLRHRDFCERVLDALQHQGLDARHLTLEVTESGLLADIEHSLPVFEHLRSLGVRMSIDDFGTGYSSFTHLRQLPVDEIKIDRSFVSHMACEQDDGAIVRSTIDLGKSIGRAIVAEGVEDAKTLDMLSTLGCDFAQGYHMCRPIPVDELLLWARARQAS